jgi:hypothetical protein
MMRNVIIVEGKDDAAFIKTLASGVETRTIEVKELGGAGKTDLASLTKALDALKNDAQLNPVSKIGIILDLDPADFDEATKLAFVNEALKSVFEIELAEVGVFDNIPSIEAQIACYFINPNLDILLRQIAAKPSPIADCLHACIENNAKPREKDKAWPLYYMRWDICDANERENGSKNVNFTHAHQKAAWNLNDPILEDLNKFLKYF